jgi:hypothetical protein
VSKKDLNRIIRKDCESRGQVVSMAKLGSTAVVEEISTDDALLCSRQRFRSLLKWKTKGS